MVNEWVAVAAINIDKNKSELSFTESHDSIIVYKQLLTKAVRK